MSVGLAQVRCALQAETGGFIGRQAVRGSRRSRMLPKCGAPKQSVGAVERQPGGSTGSRGLLHTQGDEEYSEWPGSRPGLC